MRRFWVVLGTSLLGGASIPLLGRLGGGGFGALLAVYGSIWLAFLTAIACPRTAALHLAVLTGTAAGVNFSAICRSGQSCDPEAFWFVWAMLAFCSVGPMGLGMFVGWRRQRPRRT